MRPPLLKSLGGFAASLLALSLGSVPACSTRYEPEGQFWPADRGAIHSSGGAAADDSGGPGMAVAGALVVAAGSGNAGASAATGGSGANPGSSAGGGPSNGGSMNNGGSGNPASGGRASGDTAGGSSGGATSTSASCSLSVSVTTTAPGGNYKPRNVGAIWVADGTGRFVKSLEVWGNQRLSHVTAWNAATRAAGVSGNKVDAITSATLSSHRTHNVTWNCKDYSGQVAPDGAYRVYFEVTDSNNSGPNHFESFTKGAAPVTLQASSTNFNGISLTFKP